MNRLKKFADSLLTRKFLLALVGAVVVFGNAFWNWGISDDQAWQILTPVLAFIGVEGAADLKERG